MHMNGSFSHNVNLFFFNRRKWIINSKMHCKLVGKVHTDFQVSALILFHFPDKHTTPFVVSLPESSF